MPLATLLAAPMPTNSATKISTEAMVVAELLSSALTTAMKDMLAIINITAMAIM